MAVGDTVCLLDAIGNEDGGREGALVGMVNAEPGGSLSTVLWDTGELVTGIPQARLGKVFTASNPAGLRLVGQYVQVAAYVDPDVGRPKSPSFSGVVVRAFRVGPYDSQDPSLEDDQILLIEGESGREFAFEFDDQIVVQNGRRAV